MQGLLLWHTVLVAPWHVGSQFSDQGSNLGTLHWSGLPFSLPGDLPDAGIKFTSLALQADSLPLSHLRNTVKPIKIVHS